MPQRRREFLPQTAEATRLAQRARDRAYAVGRPGPSSADWLAVLVQDEGHSVGGYLVREVCVDFTGLRVTLEAIERRSDGDVLAALPDLLSEEAADAAAELSHHYIGTEHALLALARFPTPVGDALRTAGVTWERVVACFERIQWGS